MPDNDGPFIVSDEDLEIIEELRFVRSEKADMTSRERELRAQILQVLGDADRAITGSGQPVVKIRHQPRRTVDAKKLEAMYPDIYEEVMSETDVTYLDLP